MKSFKTAIRKQGQDVPSSKIHVGGLSASAMTKLAILRLPVATTHRLFVTALVLCTISPRRLPL